MSDQLTPTLTPAMRPRRNVSFMPPCSRRPASMTGRRQLVLRRGDDLVERVHHGEAATVLADHPLHGETQAGPEAGNLAPPREDEHHAAAAVGEPDFEAGHARHRLQPHGLDAAGEAGPAAEPGGGDGDAPRWQVDGPGDSDGPVSPLAAPVPVAIRVAVRVGGARCSGYELGGHVVD